ncbi:MAG: YibE/F family protein [Acidimicrobiales bacterium]|nr:YibE/F family protein [Acidimicrobiales bacterium]
MAHRHGNRPEAEHVRRGLNWFVGAVALVTVLGVVVLWPRGEGPDLGASTQGLIYVDATVTRVDTTDCTDIDEQLPTECQEVTVRLTSGPERNDLATFLSSDIDFSAPEFSEGDDVVLLYNALAPEEFQYSFVEYQRSTPLVWLTVVFVVVVVAVGRWKGVRSLAGLALSLGVIMLFLLPALLRDQNPVAVALVTTSVIAFAALYVAHGIRASTTVALVGTLASVALITVLAAVLAGVAELTGLNDANVQTLRVTASALDLRGIVIAGMVIGALGVLDDVTVTQVAAVDELRHANPDLSARALYQGAMRIGRDHVASTINTLVLAYTGASLALLLFFQQEGRELGRVITREVVAIEIVRALVGSIGLVLSVPITTALAVATLRDDAPGDASAASATGADRADEASDHPGATADEPGGGQPRWDDFGPADQLDL